MNGPVHADRSGRVAVDSTRPLYGRFVVHAASRQVCGADAMTIGGKISCFRLCVWGSAARVYLRIHHPSAFR